MPAAKNEKVNLTLASVKKITAPGIHWDDELGGFGLRVAVDKAGRVGKTYIVKTKLKASEPGAPRKNVTVTIGPHGLWEPKGARDEARKILQQVRQGANPNDETRRRIRENEEQEKAAKREEEAQSLTVKAAIDEYFRYKANLLEATVGTYMSAMKVNFSDWYDLPLKDITTEMYLNRLGEARSAGSASNAFKGLRAVFNLAIEIHPEIISKNPIKGKYMPKLEPRDKQLADTAIKVWWNATESLTQPDYADYFQLLLLTGLRSKELARMKWKDVNFIEGYWTVMKTKNKRNHSLPMSDYVRKVLEARYEMRSTDFVFPGAGSKSGGLTNTRHQQARVVKFGGAEFSPHALRRTFARVAAMQRTPPYVVRRFLNHHSAGDVTQNSYLRFEIDSLRQPLQAVEDAILVLAGVKRKEQPQAPLLRLVND